MLRAIAFAIGTTSRGGHNTIQMEVVLDRYPFTIQWLLGNIRVVKPGRNSDYRIQSVVSACVQRLESVSQRQLVSALKDKSSSRI